MDAFGFEQFQKYTSNNFRELSEKTYCQRFLQLSGNDMKNVKHIEGRFSPKGTLDDNVAIINKIMDGFEGLRQCRKQAGLMLPTMTLLAHFIKKGDNGKGNNVVIGHHHSFSTYHLYNWYKWSKEGEKIPAIVVGTDDAGIFATNIYNEYCHIYCMLVFDKGLSPFEAMDYIERLVHNAKVYVFK